MAEAIWLGNGRVGSTGEAGLGVPLGEVLSGSLAHTAVSKISEQLSLMYEKSRTWPQSGGQSR